MSNNQKANKRTNRFILTGFLVVIVIWLGYLVIYPYFNTDLDKRALTGDSFGGLNALFSGLAFAGVIATILLQREELRLQRVELENTRKELKRSADAQQQSEKAFRQQVLIMAKQSLLDLYLTKLRDAEMRLDNPHNNISTRSKLLDLQKTYKNAVDKYVKELEKLERL